MSNGKDAVKIFVAGSCTPCREIKKLIAEGKCNIPDIEIVDVETEEGFANIEKMKLERVPSAFLGDKVCKLSVDDQTHMLNITCPEAA
jgi:glutaredoxin